MTDSALLTSLDAYKLNHDQVKVTSRELGQGSYSTVVELEYMGLKCTGKKIHNLLEGQELDTYFIQQFKEECCILSQVRHPNIVQFLGVHFQPGVRAPILVMEFLPTNLTSCVEQYGILPKEISYSILHDVAVGLCYLHSQTPPIIHRDLSSNNVLLTSNMTAKISDVGVARILKLTPRQFRCNTQTPGNPDYMPPEDMEANPTFNTTIDIFSFGTMMIHVLSGEWPEPQVGPIHAEPGRLIPMSEAERRDKFLQAIGKDHPLMDLVIKCIDNHPEARAHASEIVQRLAEVRLQPQLVPSRLEMLKSLTEGGETIAQLREANQKLSVTVERLRKESQDKDGRNQPVSRVEAEDSEKRMLKRVIERHENTLLSMQQALERKDKQIEKHRIDETARLEEISRIKAALKQKDDEMTRLVQKHRAELLRVKMKQVTSPHLGVDDVAVPADRRRLAGASCTWNQPVVEGNPTMQRGRPRVVMHVDSRTFQQVVQPGDVKNENWVAVNLMSFCQKIELLYEVILHACTDASCPMMSGGPKFLYYWADEVQKKPQALSAPQYIAKLLRWAERQMNNERIFPKNFKAAVLEPDAVVPICKKIFRRLYRVFVHIYVFHYDQFVEIGAEMNLNSCYIHFYYFVREYDLIPLKELEPLMELNFQLIEKKKLLQ